MSAGGEAEAEWDTSKENFVPVKQGRATAALVTPVSVRKRDKELEDAKRAFLEDIRAAADDPLPAWLKYIKWTQEQYSTQASRKELTQALEAATKALSSLKQYHEDVRLLRIWVQYADCLPDPSSVFLYLEDHNIGRDHALFYEAYAAYLELKGNFSQADLVYQEGIKRLAKPLERLKQKHAAFNQRMAKRRERQESEAAIGMGPAADPASARSTLAPLVPLDSTPQLDENGRPIQQPRPGLGRSAVPLPQHGAASVALGVRPAPLPTASGSSSRGGRGAAGGAASLWAPASSGASTQQQRSSALLLSSLGVPGAGGSSSNAAPRQLDVHVDEEFGPSGRGAIPTAFPPSLQQHAQLPGLAVATKENSTQPAVWAGTKLKQQGILTGPVSNKLEVFEDEDSEEPGDGGPLDAAAAPDQQPGLRQRLDAPLAPAAAAAPLAARAGVSAPDSQAAPAAAAAVRKQQALQAPPAAAVAPAQQQKHSGSGSSKGAAQVPAVPAGGPPQGYDEALLVGPDGEERSFEEVRAAAWRKAHAAKACQQQQQQEVAHTGSASPPAAPAAGPTDQPLQQPAPLHASSVSAADGEAGAVAASCSSKQQQAVSGSGRRHPLGDAGALPAKPAAAGRSVSPSEASAAAANGAAGSCTAAATAGSSRSQADHSSASSSSSGRRPPLAAGSAQAAAAAAAAAAAGPAVDDAAGGVTINTQAAFDAMNGMFGGADDTTTMHGFGGAATAGRAGAGAAAAARRRSMAAGDLGGVTMNTRAALDAMNGMFGGSDDTTTLHGFGRQVAAAAVGSRRSLAAGDLGGVTMNTRAAFDAMNGMFGGDDTTTMHGFGRQGSAAASHAAGAAGMEPTITVNTRAAFDYMNGVFGAAGDVTMNQTGGVGARRGPRKTSRLAASAAAASGSSSGAAAAPLGLYEDTELINPAGGSAHNPGCADQGPMFGVYEDTEFVGAKMAAAGGSSSGRGSDGAAGGSFGLYEDTDFITRHVGGAALGSSSSGRPSLAGPGMGAGAGLGLYEDTDFITRPAGKAGHGSSGDRHSMAGAAGGGGLGLYEDTEFIAQPAAGSSGRGDPDGSHGGTGYGSNQLSLYEDTEFIAPAAAGAAAAAAAGAGAAAAPSSAQSGGQGAGLGLYEDTEFITRTVPPAAAAAAAVGGSGGSGSGSLLLTKLNRLSLANEALYRGQRGGSRGDENAAPPAAPGGSLGLYEDTEFIGDAGRPGSLGSGSGGAEGGDFEVYADTEFLTKPVAAAAAADHRGGSGATCSSSGGNTSSCSKENAAGSAEDGSSSWQHHHHQQQVRQDDLRVQGSSGRPRGLAPHPVSPRAAVGMCGSGSSILQQQHSLGYGGAGPSRFGPGSVPNSPGAPVSRPGSAKSTPGRPPRTPGTPGAGLGPMAKHMDSFEVMESPAVHEALAGRAPYPATAASSPAGSFASSPGFGARENSMPGQGAPEGKEGQRLQPRSLADRSARAAALQPISASRAELLGVQVDPHALAEGGEDADEWGQEQQHNKGAAVRQSPGRALRSLQFGRGGGIGAPTSTKQ